MNSSSSAVWADPSLGSRHFLNCGSLTHGFVVDKLVEKCASLGALLRSGQRVTGLTAVEVNASNGYTSRLFRCQLEMEEEGKRKSEPRQQQQFPFILKVFSDDRVETMLANFAGPENVKEMTEFFSKMGNSDDTSPTSSAYEQMHRNECNLYELMGSGGPTVIPLPRVFYTQKMGEVADGHGGQGLILMEDLSERSQLVPFERGLSTGQVEEVVAHLARLHGHLMANEDKAAEVRKKFLRMDEMFQNQQKEGEKLANGGEAEENGEEKKREEEEKENGQAKFMTMMISQMDDGLLQPMRRMGRLLTTPQFAQFASKKCTEEWGVPETLCHGDLWSNNLLWDSREPDKLAAFIDWQLTSRANPLSDVARLLVQSAEPEVRHQLERGGRIVRVYLDALNTKLAEKGVNPVAYGQDELEHVYGLALVGQSLACAMVLTFFQRVWADDPDGAQKLASARRRAATAVTDALAVLEREAPEWLDPAEEEEAAEKGADGDG